MASALFPRNSCWKFFAARRTVVGFGEVEVGKWHRESRIGIGLGTIAVVGTALRMNFVPFGKTRIGFRQLEVAQLQSLGIGFGNWKDRRRLEFFSVSG